MQLIHEMVVSARALGATQVLGIIPEQDSLFGLSQAVKNFAIRKAGEGRSVVVLVDEAQDLGLEAV